MRATQTTKENQMSNSSHQKDMFSDHRWGSSYWSDKKKRTEMFESIKGKKLVKCYACNGSGYYDSNNSPECEECGGSGKVREY